MRQKRKILGKPGDSGCKSSAKSWFENPVAEVETYFGDHKKAVNTKCGVKDRTEKEDTQVTPDAPERDKKPNQHDADCRVGKIVFEGADLLVETFEDAVYNAVKIEQRDKRG